MILEDKTSKIIGAFYNVYNKLGYGFLEKVHENALIIELKKYSFDVKRQHPITVYYENVPVGEYFADIVADDSIIIEIKTAETLVQAHEFQLLNYLKATKTEIGLLLNFGKKAEIRREIFTNE